MRKLSQTFILSNILEDSLAWKLYIFCLVYKYAEVLLFGLKYFVCDARFVACKEPKIDVHYDKTGVYNVSVIIAT